MAISMLKIRRPLGRLIFNMGIAIPGKTVFLIETAPRFRLFPLQCIGRLNCSKQQCYNSISTHLPRDKMAVISQTTFLEVYILIKTWLDSVPQFPIDSNPALV